MANPFLQEEVKMDIQTKHLSVRKKARYSTYGILSGQTKYFWFALHGSKMRCEQMVYKFEKFDSAEHFIVAPEGMSRFYLKGFGGEVVASWMTSRDRLEEIDDLSNYLSELYDHYRNLLNPEVKKVILGFSQGGTTAFRWLHQKQVLFDRLIAYSCRIPEDIPLSESKSELGEILYTYGEQDQFFGEETMKSILETTRLNKLNIRFESYEGDHRVEKEQLNRLFKKYIE